MLKRTVAQTRILECCLGTDVEAQKTAAQGTPEPFLLGAKSERAKSLAAGSDDKYRGQDMRGRLMSQDFREYLWDPHEKSDSQSTARNRTQAEWGARYNALIEYWAIVPALVHNRDLWKPFLARNAMAADQRHAAAVSAAETELQTVLKDHTPGPDWAEAAGKLRLAYINERSVIAKTVLSNREPASFTPRSSGCPPPGNKQFGNCHADRLIHEAIAR